MLRDLNATRWLGTPRVGVPASSVPSTGEHGPAYLYPWLQLHPEYASALVRGAIVTPPESGTLLADEDTSFVYTPDGDGAFTFTFQPYVNGVAVGSPQEIDLLSGGAAVFPSGIPSAEAFGTPTVTRAGSVVVLPTGIPSAEAFGTATVTRQGAAQIIVPGIPSAEAFGNPTVTTSSAASVFPSGIPSAEAFGSPYVEVGGGALIGSWVSVAEANAYILDFHGSDHAWFSASNSNRRIWLRQATQYLQTVYCIKPEYLDPLHENVMKAVCEAAIRAMSGPLQQDVEPNQVKSETVGPISTTYADQRNGGQVKIAIVTSLLKGLTCGTSGMVKLVRA